MDFGKLRFTHNKVEMSAHGLPGTKLIAETLIGSIYRMPLNSSKQKFDIQVPSEVAKLLEIDNRNKLISDLNWNRFDTNMVLGRPSSTFLVYLPEGLFIDFIEIQNNIKENRQPHDFIRQNINYSSALIIPINPRAKFLSGHIVPLTISTADVNAIFMMDAFSGSKPNISNPDVAGIMAILKGNRILPITSDGYLI